MVKTSSPMVCVGLLAVVVTAIVIGLTYDEKAPTPDEMQAVMMSLEFRNDSRYLSTKQLDEMVASGVVETAIASVLEEVSWCILET